MPSVTLLATVVEQDGVNPYVTNPSNVLVEDSTDATGFIDSSNSRRFIVRTFGVDAAIPSGAAITDVQCTVKLKYTNGVSGATGMVLNTQGIFSGTDGVQISGSQIGNTGGAYVSRTDNVRKSGGPLPSGLLPTRADLLDAVFKLRVIGVYGGASGTWSIDVVKLVITYTDDEHFFFSNYA